MASCASAMAARFRIAERNLLRHSHASTIADGVQEDLERGTGVSTHSLVDAARAAQRAGWVDAKLFAKPQRLRSRRTLRSTSPPPSLGDGAACYRKDIGLASASVGNCLAEGHAGRDVVADGRKHCEGGHADPLPSPGYGRSTDRPTARPPGRLPGRTPDRPAARLHDSPTCDRCRSKALAAVRRRAGCGAVGRPSRGAVNGVVTAAAAATAMTAEHARGARRVGRLMPALSDGWPPVDPGRRLGESCVKADAAAVGHLRRESLLSVMFWGARGVRRTMCRALLDPVCGASIVLLRGVKIATPFSDPQSNSVMFWR